MIRFVAVLSRLQLLFENATNDMLVALKYDAVARPVIGVDACGIDTKQIVNERILLSVSSAGGGDILKCSDRAHHEYHGDEDQSCRACDEPGKSALPGLCREYAQTLPERPQQ